MVGADEERRPFNALAPLLPEELCWILDRSFAYEVNVAHPPNCFLGVVMYFVIFLLCYPDGMARWEQPIADSVHIALRAPSRRIRTRSHPSMLNPKTWPSTRIGHYSTEGRCIGTFEML